MKKDTLISTGDVRTSSAYIRFEHLHGIMKPSLNSCFLRTESEYVVGIETLSRPQDKLEVKRLVEFFSSRGEAEKNPLDDFHVGKINRCWAGKFFEHRYRYLETRITNAAHPKYRQFIKNRIK